MGRTNSSRRDQLGGSVVLLMIALGLLGLGVLLSRLGLDFADKFGSAASLLVALFALSLPLVAGQIGRIRNARPASDLTVGDARDEVARALAQRWSENDRWRRVYDPWPLPVSWVDDGSGRSGGFGEVVGCFTALPERRLIILGAAGSGKSVLAQKLARDLLGQRRSADLVPVIAPAATWQPGQSFAQWIEEGVLSVLPELAAPPARAMGIATVAGMIARDGAIPIIDGLDELPDHVRAQLVEMINVHGSDQPFALTSRPDEFAEAVAAAGRPVTSSTVVTIQPLRLSDAQRYLRESTGGDSDRWAALFAATRPGEPMAAVLTNPLTLWLMRTVYEQPTSRPSSLLEVPQTRETIENRLFEHFLPAAYRQIGSATPRWRSDRARHWLGAQARWMHWAENGQARQELRWWSLAAWNASLLASTVGLVRAALKALAVTIALTWAAGFYRQRADVVASTLREALANGIVGRRALPALQEAATASTPLWDTIASLFPQRTLNVVVSLIVVTVVFVWSGHKLALPAAPAWVPRAWLVLISRRAVTASVVFLGAVELARVLDGRPLSVSGTLLWGVLAVAVLVAGACRPRLVTAAEASTPVAGLDADFRATVANALAHVFVATVACGLLLGFHIALILAAAGTALLLARLVFGSQRSHATAYEAYAEARLGLWLTGRGPWNTIGFLQDAHVRGVLRQSGMAYQFRHARLLEHLAGDRDPVERIVLATGLVDLIQHRWYPWLARRLAPLGRRVDTRAAAAGVDVSGDLTRRFSDDAVFVPYDERPDLSAVPTLFARVVVDAWGRVAGHLPRGRHIVAATLLLPLGLDRARRYLHARAEPVRWPGGHPLVDGVADLDHIRLPQEMPAVPSMLVRPGETVVWASRRHPITLVTPVLLGLTAIGATRILIDPAARWLETLLCALLALWMIYRVADHYRERYVLTDQRLIHQSGLVFQTTEEQPISSVLGAKGFQGPLELSLNFGSIYLDLRPDLLRATLSTSALGQILRYSTLSFRPRNGDMMLQVGQPLEIFIALRDLVARAETIDVNPPQHPI